MIIAIDKTNKLREAIRRVIVEFFLKNLGFTLEDIIFVDRTEFIGDVKNGIYQTKFSAETQERMKKFARSIFTDTQFGLANQVLNIAICECQGGDFHASNYFKMGSNFELTIKLTDNFSLTNAEEYFDGLRQKIVSNELTQIIFKECNDFFEPDLQRGVDPYQTNKMNSGFHYRL